MTAAKIPVGVLGGSGYTGLEVLRVLRGHDGVTVRFATSDSEAGRDALQHREPVDQPQRQTAQ